MINSLRAGDAAGWRGRLSRPGRKEHGGTRLELPMGRQVVIGHDELNIGK
jgi:hypothetical protein